MNLLIHIPAWLITGVLGFAAVLLGTVLGVILRDTCAWLYARYCGHRWFYHAWLW